MTKKPKKTHVILIVCLIIALIAVVISIALHAKKTDPTKDSTKTDLAAVTESMTEMGTDTHLTVGAFGINQASNKELARVGYLTNDGHVPFELNGVKLTFPMSYKDLIDAGFTPQMDIAKKEIQPKEHIDFIPVSAKDKTGVFYIDCYNPTNKVITTDTSTISGIAVYATESADLNFKIWKDKIKLGMTSDEGFDFFQNSDMAVNHVTPQGEIFVGCLFPEDTQTCEEIYMTLYRESMDHSVTSTEEMEPATGSAK